MRSLICSSDYRLGQHGVEEFKVRQISICLIVYSAHSSVSVIRRRATTADKNHTNSIGFSVCTGALAVKIYNKIFNL